MKKIATREAYGSTLASLVKENNNIIVLDADLSKSTKTVDAKLSNPDCFFNIGIAECNMVGIAGGLASCNKTVFASSFAMFLAGRAFEQIRNTIAYPKLNVKLCATHAGISVGEDGASHQCIEDLSLMRSIPDMTVLSPSDAVETEEMIKAISNYPGPCYVRLSRYPVSTVNDKNNYTFKLGKGVTLKKGNDVTIIATGTMVEIALQVHNDLKTKGIDAEIINIHTIKPLDKSLIIESASRTKCVITLEEHSVIGGLGSAISEVLSEELPTKVLKIGINDCFGQSGKAEDLFKEYKLTTKDIVPKVINFKNSDL